MHYAYEVSDATIMTNQNIKPIMNAFFDRLILRQSPHAPSPELYRRQAQVMCGRWLALRRLDLGLNLAHLAEAVGLMSEAILFVETGLADAALGTTPTWQSYSQALAGRYGDLARVHTIVMIALGRVASPSERVMMRVLLDLNALDATRPATLARAPASAGAGAPSSVSPWLLILRWIDKSIAAMHTSVAGSLKLDVLDRGGATALTLPEINPHVVYNTALQRDTKPPAWVEQPGSAAILDGIMQYLAAGNEQSLHAVGAPGADRPVDAPLQQTAHSVTDNGLQFYMRTIQGASTPAAPLSPYWARGAASPQLVDEYVELATNGPARILRRFERPSARPPAPPGAAEWRLPPSTGDHETTAYLRRRPDPSLRNSAPITLTLACDELVGEAVAHIPRLVLLGESGSGKSTSLRYLMLRLSQSYLDSAAALPTGWHTPKVPILCSLQAFADILAARTPHTPHELLQSLLQAQSAPPDARRDTTNHDLQQALLDGEALLLLDGLDQVSEVADPSGQSPRVQIIAAIRQLGQALPLTTRIVVACRTCTYQHSAAHTYADQRLHTVDGWQVRTLRPLALDQIRLLARRRLVPPPEPTFATAMAHYDGGPAASIAARISADHTLARLYTSPLSLSLLLTLFNNDQALELPHNRVHLYERFVTLSLRSASTAHSYPPPPAFSPLRSASDDWSRAVVRRSALQAVAFEAMQPSATPQASERARAEALGELQRLFPHMIMREFLAACHLAGLPDVVLRAAAIWHSSTGDHWRDVLIMLAGRLQQIGLGEEAVIPWLRQLAANTATGSSRSARQRQRDALLAADSWQELGGRNGFAGSDSLQVQSLEHELADALLLVLARQPLATTIERLSAGTHLALLGDARPGVLGDEPDWCVVSAGPVGRNQTASGAATEHATPHLARFQISRYPVTHAQWQHFINAGGYTDPRWWSDQWSETNPAQPRFWETTSLTAASLPVVGISWYEAAAFCAWLTARGRVAGWLGDHECVRLPTVQEWQQAACGTDGRIYPWGDAWDSDYAHTGERAVAGMAPVGCYPQGESPYGVLDMAGNVAEWCMLPESATLPAHSLASSFTTVRCGGSWAESQLEARSAHYRVTAPETRGNLLGMRVVRVAEP